MQTQTQTTPAFLTVAELAERLGVSRRNAYYLVRDAAVPVLKIRGRFRVPADALEEWLEARSREALQAVRSNEEAS